MNEQTPASHFEPRWPIALSIVSLILILALLPERIRMLPMLVTYALGVAVLVPVAAVGLTTAAPRWLSVERAVTLIFVVVVGLGTLANLVQLIGVMLYRSSETTGLQLLTSSIAVWVTNVFVFSLLYWQVDRGGPEARMIGMGKRPEWMFSQDSAPASETSRDWLPAFIDYLYLAYSTATTDTIPLTPRAKLLMMVESAISLLTIVLIASRAINILGS